jgi:hypothetical protein
MSLVCDCSRRYPAMRMRHIVICALPHSAILFAHYLINCAISEKKLLNIKCLFWFCLQILFQKIFILIRAERNMIKIYIVLRVKYPLFLSDFNETWIFWTDFREILKFQIFKNTCSGSRVVPCGQTERQTDGRTEMTKLIVAFRNFANAPSKY